MPDQVFPSPAPVNNQEVQVMQPPSPNTGVITSHSEKKVPKSLILIILAVATLGLAIFLVVRALSRKAVEGGEVTWWGLWEDEAVINPLIDEYQKEHPKVKLTYIRQSPQDYRERLTNALAKGGGPDIFIFHNSWVPMFKNDLDQIPAEVMNASDFAQIFYPVATIDLTNDVGMVGIPLEYDALTLFINEDIFNKAQKSPPTTWDDLRSLATDLTQKDDQGNIIQSGVALGRTENVDHWPEILALMMLQNGVNLVSPTGKLAEDALKFYTIFSSADGVWDATLPPSTAAFAGGKLAMYFAPSWRAFEIIEKNPSLKFKTVPLPQLPKSGSNQKEVSYATYWVSGVWARSKHKAIAWDFLKFISSRDALAKLYANASRQRLFGEPYSRVDMADLVKDHPLVGSIISQAPDAQSWFLQSRTFDGPTGINSLINKYFEDAVNAVNSGSSADKALQTAALGVKQVLQQYGMIK